MRRSDAVRDAAERCAEPLCDTVAALGACWRDVADRSASVSVHATNVGQQITVPAGGRPLRTAEGVT